MRIRLARARRWEFWPSALFYLPVVGWIIWLGIRFGHASAFTAANPGMDDGGVVGERKSRLLLGLAERCSDTTPPLELLPASLPGPDRKTQALRFAAINGYPLVLKPDIGQRGRGVAIIRHAEAIGAYLDAADFDVLIQGYAEGTEFGVFVYREPASGKLQIYSITEKRLPEVVGNGRDSLAQLILDDARTWLIAPLLFRQHAADLDRIPEVGERLRLVDLGTHCRGATFLDGCELGSEALRSRLDQITAQLLPGFCFGRLDLKAPDRAALSRGEKLQIVEVNGVTSESAHVYQPGTSLAEGYRVFFRQWWLAFSIGKANLRAGAPAVSPVRLLHLWLQDLRRFDAAEAAVAAANRTRLKLS